MTSEERLLDAVSESDAVSYCRDLVRIGTVNPPGDERKAAEYVASALNRMGLQADLVSHGAARASVVARLKGSGEKPALLYNGHLDTVPVGAEEWAHGAFAGEIADGKVWGRGASDMKGGLAAMMAGIKALAGVKPALRGDLIFAATAGEEVDSLGASAVAAMPGIGPLQAIVISEPSSNELFLAEKGAFWLELTTRGKTSHGSMPEQGRNAIVMMMRLLAALEKESFPFREHPLVGGFTRSVNTIAGGVKTNVVPDSCTATVDMRTVPGQDHGAILRQVEDLAADLGRSIPDFKAEVKVANDRAPVETSPSEPAVGEFIEVLSAITGVRPVPRGVAYFSDAVVLVPAFHAPMILCGPGEARLAHQPNEHVEIFRLGQAARIFALAAARLLG